MSENAADMLERLGTDAALWAKEFRKTAIRLGYSDMDEDWLIGWFANAIERCDVMRCNPLRAELAAERESAESYKQTYYNSHKENCKKHNRITELATERDALRAGLAEAKIEIERQRARVIKWVNAAMRNEEYDDDGR